ncbi:MAG: futalosine hydrolase [Nitrospinae bacterium]|nr:futalosine hydrolase [Nitrospinota bacterium]
MKILIVAATELEIRPLLTEINFKNSANNFSQGFMFKGHSLDVLITGIGMVAAAYHLGKALANQQYDFAFNLGLAGSFKGQGAGEGSAVALGEVVHVTSDRLVELGIGQPDGFVSFAELDFLPEGGCAFKSNELPFACEALNALPKVSGVTVNKITADKKKINMVVEQFHPAVESMEGAAFLYACQEEGLPCIQLRAVSNYAGVRDKNEWNIPLAVRNLNKTALEVLNFRMERG